jgi:hypothetical protein
MKKGSITSTTRIPGTSPASVFAIAALVFLLLAAGCTTGKPAATPVPTVPPTTVETTAITVIPTPTTEAPDVIADRAFAAAADICYQNTPVITNLTTHLAFATCMKDTPLPPGNCAQNYRYYVLKYTNEDASTAGFARETNNVHLARDAFLRNEGYDGVRLEYVPCGGNATVIKSSFYK